MKRNHYLPIGEILKKIFGFILLLSILPLLFLGLMLLSILFGHVQSILGVFLGFFSFALLLVIIGVIAALSFELMDA